MSAQEFFLALELSGTPPTSELWQDLAARVLAFVGCSPERAKPIVEGLGAALGKVGDTNDPSRLEFNMSGGELTLTQSTNDRPLWRTTHPTP